MIALLAILLLVGIYNFVDFGTSSAAPLPRLRNFHANSNAERQEIQRARHNCPTARLIPDCASTSWPPAKAKSMKPAEEISFGWKN